MPNSREFLAAWSAHLIEHDVKRVQAICALIVITSAIGISRRGI
jgi:hypothetical protein